MATDAMREVMITTKRLTHVFYLVVKMATEAMRGKIITVKGQLTGVLSGS